MRGTPVWTTTVIALCLMILIASAAIAPGSASASPLEGKPPASQSYPNTSWAMGVVVPEGSQLQGGGRLSWGQVSNLTADLVLPNITRPDASVYGVLSVMTSDGSVLQVAAGLQANSTVWLVYGWFIGNARSIPLEYTWVLNGSKPSLVSGSRVSLSIFRLEGNWALKVTDLGTRSSVGAVFPTAETVPIAMGDQEVFALESYSRLVSTFIDMGNLTLNGLLTDGQRIVAGFYSYGLWDPTHSLLFVVGGAGTGPPAFISLGQPSPGGFTWGFSTSWGSNSSVDRSMGNAVAAILLIAVFVFILAGFAALRRTTRKRQVVMPCRNLGG